MNKKEFKLQSFLITFILIFALLSSSASADTGPKPSVNIEFSGINGNPFYATLLSESEASGPWSYNEEKDDINDYGIDEDVWKAFSSYTDDDGFYLLPYIQKCTDNFKWGYYPPKTFKILLYFPEKNAFAVSKIYERYAFDSYYEIDLNSLSEKTQINGATIFIIRAKEVRSYDFKSEVLGLLARIALTIAVEVLIALLLGYKGKKTFLTILLVNVATQLLLNIALNIEAYRHGTGYNYLTLFANLEIFIFATEAIIYFFTLYKFSKEPDRWVTVLYAFIANLSSFIFGYKLSEYLPTVF